MSLSEGPSGVQAPEVREGKHIHDPSAVSKFIATLHKVGLASIAAMALAAAGCAPVVDAKTAQEAATKANEFGNRKGSGDEKVEALKDTTGDQGDCNSIVGEVRADVPQAPARVETENDLNAVVYAQGVDAKAAQARAMCYKAVAKATAQAPQPSASPSAGPAPAPTPEPSVAPSEEPAPAPKKQSKKQVPKFKEDVE